MFLRVDPSSHTPIYQQIVDEVRTAVAAGRLSPGERLPGARELAQERAINLQTIEVTPSSRAGRRRPRGLRRPVARARSAAQSRTKVPRGSAKCCPGSGVVPGS
jgi:DNA-binding transcriptional MocR family regulator